MSLGRLTFERPAARGAPSASTRADVACFVGFGRLRSGAELELEPSWAAAGFTREQRARAAASPATDALPVPLQGWEAFPDLIEAQQAAGPFRWETPLAGAVRDFFRQGGLRCHVVLVPPPAAPPRDPAAVDAAIGALVPGVRGSAAAIPHDRKTWRGMGHLFGLPEVGLVCLPDLPWVVADAQATPPEVDEPEPPPPQFVECAVPFDPLASAAIVRVPGEPRVGEAGLARWTSAVHDAVDWLRRWRRDGLLVAALPLCDPLSPVAADLFGHLAGSGHLDASGVGSAFLQIAWPWLRSDTSEARPGRLAQPDGALVGLLARNALSRGTFASAVDAATIGVHGCEPRDPVGRPRSEAGRIRWLSDRVSVVVPDARGQFRLASDVTATSDPSWRRGGVARLVGVLIRAAREVGEAYTFQPSGPLTWRELTRAYEGVLRALALEGAFVPGEGAFTVRCDGTTMTQADLDAGRLIANVEFLPVGAVERLRIALVVGDTLGPEVAA